MRYMEETKTFWKLGCRHFGGRFIRFMSGFKNTTQLVSGENKKGSFCVIPLNIHCIVLTGLKQYTVQRYQILMLKPKPYTCTLLQHTLHVKARTHAHTHTHTHTHTHNINGLYQSN
jgi:hypothetical protein